MPPGAKTSSHNVALTAKKSPPPELPESIRVRSLVVFSFWAVIVFLGLPIWWRTTSIYRARLPLRDMMEWADGKACRPVFPLQICIEAPFLQESEAQHLIRTTQHALDDLNEFSAHHLRLRLTQSLLPTNASTANVGTSTGGLSLSMEPELDEDVALTLRLRLQETATMPTAEFQPYSPTLDIFYAQNQIPPTSSTSSPLARFIANTLQETFTEEQATIAYILATSLPTVNSPQSSLPVGQAPLSSQSAPPSMRELRSTLIRSVPADLAANLARRTTRSLKYAPTYHLTLSVFTPNSTPSSWDIDSAIEDYLSPLLQSFSSISNFTVDTQVQLYASFSPSVQEPRYDPERGAWTLRNEDLSGFINAAEWPLSPSIGTGPTVNFVVFVPSADEAPLVVKDNGANSWLVPQWGGVMILNPPVPGSNVTALPLTLSKEALRPVLTTFSHQLLSLLGTPQSPRSLPLRLLTLTRVRAASLLLSASSTLGSLARLTLALPSISIPESVAASVDKTILHLHKTCADLRDGKFQSALQHARVAETEAERGFFEKSMVGQVYFPDEHKIAVYLPLLGPVGVPLIMGALKEIRRLSKNWKKRTEAKK
ncbi:MAG: GPI transamidase component [Pleopsidium flavum]|nr:MAG: GPI transamidase component [Pleopsidium flavum]